MARELVSGFDFDITMRRDVHTRYAAAGAAIKASNFIKGVVYGANGVTVNAFEVDHGRVAPLWIPYRLRGQIDCVVRCHSPK